MRRFEHKEMDWYQLWRDGLISTLKRWTDIDFEKMHWYKLCRSHINPTLRGRCVWEGGWRGRSRWCPAGRAPRVVDQPGPRYQYREFIKIYKSGMTLFVEEDRIHLRKSVSTNSPLDGRQVERKCPWEQNLNIKRKKEEKKGCFTLWGKTPKSRGT